MTGATHNADSIVEAGWVDVHAHFVTDEYVAAAEAAGHSHPDGMPGWPCWSVAQQFRNMDRMRPLLAELDRRSTIAFVHPTSPPNHERVSLGRPRPMVEFMFDATRTLADLAFSGRLAEFPNIRWIFSHGGAVMPLLAHRLELFRTVFSTPEPGAAGIPELLSRLWFDMAGTPFPHQVPTLVSVFGSERILYGSDSCWTPERGVAAQIESIAAAEPPAAGDSWLDLTNRSAARLLAARPPRS